MICKHQHKFFSLFKSNDNIKQHRSQRKNLNINMTSQCPTSFRHVARGSPCSATSYRALLQARRDGFMSVTAGKLTPDRENGGGPTTTSLEMKLTKLLVKVNIDRSLGPVQVVMSPESEVRDLVKAAIRIYVKEKRRPLLKETDPDRFELHYSQFSLDCLQADEKLKNLGSRNFFLCTKASASVSSSSSSCPVEPEALSAKCPFSLPKLLDFLP